jgi:sensor histidine kinase regulating citrate/malate metabolism
MKRTAGFITALGIGCGACAQAPNAGPAAAMSAQAPMKAQQMVEQTLARHPEAAHIVMHVTPPNRPETENVIIGSNIGKIGKLADEDDLRIVHTGKPETVVAKTGDRFNVSLPFYDAGGKTIGVVAVGFPYKEGDDKAKLQQRAVQIRDELKGQIPSAGYLFEPR